jgi:ArsR family transcriptional regulator
MNKHTSLPTVRGEQLRPAVRLIKALAHPVRLNIIRVIHNNDGCANVGEIYSALDLEQSIASQHLRVLRQAALVNTRRDRKFIYYSLDYDRIVKTTLAVSLLGD